MKRRVPAVLGVIAAVPAGVIILLAIAVAAAIYVVYAAANLALAVALGTWRRDTDPHAAGPYSMAGIDREDVERFHAALMGLCQDMARAAARADAQDLGEGTQQ